MRTVIILLIIALLAALTYLSYAHLSGGAVPTFGLPIGGEKGKVRSRVVLFFEDVKFKNSAGLKEFVAPSVSAQEILAYLEKGLGLNADQDLTSVAIKQIELDNQEQRARVKINLSGDDLRSRKPFSVEKLIFLYKTPHDKWLVDITSAFGL